MTSVAVVGGGIAGLTAAWELARAGLHVEVYESGAQPGGAVAPMELGGMRLDAGADAFATRSPAVGDLIADLGLTDRIVLPHPAGAWLQLPDLASPLPATGLLGIPGDPQSPEVSAILGAEAAARAAQDLTAPMQWPGLSSASGRMPSLGEVVAERMGQAVVDKLVAPITAGVHSSAPEDLAVSAAHPKLYETMVAQGSLARAVAQLKAAAPAGSAVQSLEGGMNTLAARLHSCLHQLGASVHLARPVHDLGGLEADHVVLAVDEQQTAKLAGPLLPGWAPEPGPGPAGVALVTALVYAPELDASPRGTGMLVAPSVDNIGAKAMTHITAKWQWARQRAHAQFGPGHHLIRLSYGRVTDTPSTGSLGFASTDRELLSAAAEDIPQLTGVPISTEQMLDLAVVRWRGSLPAASVVQRRRAAEFRDQLSRTQGGGGTPRLWAVGAWAAGTGLSQVIPDARAVASAVVDSQ